MSNKIHPTAVVDKSAELFDDVEVGPHCVIGPNVRVGPGTKFLSHVVVDGWTTIGERNVFFPFSVVGAIPQDLKYRGEKTTLTIGNDNSIREGVTIHLGTTQGGGVTSLGNGNLLMGYVHVGHDCRIGNSCILANYVGLAGHVRIDDFANLGGMVGVSQYVHVGPYTYVTGQSGLEKDLPPYSIAIGSRPTHLRGANIVGLRRKGISAEIISKIGEAMKLWTRPNIEKEACLNDIDAQYGDVPEIKTFVSFIRESKNGVVK